MGRDHCAKRWLIRRPGDRYVIVKVVQDIRDKDLLPDKDIYELVLVEDCRHASESSNR